MLNLELIKDISLSDKNTTNSVAYSDGRSSRAERVSAAARLPQGQRHRPQQTTIGIQKGERLVERKIE